MPSRVGRNQARHLRRNATDAERLLWRHLRQAVVIPGPYFRRQAVLGPYFVDFRCFSRRLVIELDGSQHGSPVGQAADAERTLYLEQHGYRVLRFWNVQIFSEIGGVLDTISAALSDPHR